MSTTETKIISGVIHLYYITMWELLLATLGVSPTRRLFQKVPTFNHNLVYFSTVPVLLKCVYTRQVCIFKFGLKNDSVNAGLNVFFLLWFGPKEPNYKCEHTVKSIPQSTSWTWFTHYQTFVSETMCSKIDLKYQSCLISSKWMESESEAKENLSLCPSYTKPVNSHCSKSDFPQLVPTNSAVIRQKSRQKS